MKGNRSKRAILAFFDVLSTLFRHINFLKFFDDGLFS